MKLIYPFTLKTFHPKKNKNNGSKVPQINFQKNVALNTGFFSYFGH